MTDQHPNKEAAALPALFGSAALAAVAPTSRGYFTRKVREKQEALGPADEEDMAMLRQVLGGQNVPHFSGSLEPGSAAYIPGWEAESLGAGDTGAVMTGADPSILELSHEFGHGTGEVPGTTRQQLMNIGHKLSPYLAALMGMGLGAVTKRPRLGLGLGTVGGTTAGGLAATPLLSEEARASERAREAIGDIGYSEDVRRAVEEGLTSAGRSYTIPAWASAGAGGLGGAAAGGILRRNLPRIMAALKSANFNALKSEKEAAGVADFASRTLQQAAGTAPAQSLQEIGQRMSTSTLRRLIESGADPYQAERIYHNMQTGVREALPEAEESALQRAAPVIAPVKGKETAQALLAAGAVPMAFNALRRKPTGFIQGLRTSLGGKALPFTALFDILGAAAAPLSDPSYARGERGYAGSVGKAFQRQSRQLGKQTGRGFERHGLLGGTALSALHGIVNPISAAGRLAQSISGLGKGVYEKLTGSAKLAAMATTPDLPEQKPLFGAEKEQPLTWGNRLRGLLMGADPRHIQRMQRDLERYNRIRSTILKPLQRAGILGGGV